VSETALFNEAFSLSEPKEGAARVRLAENDGSRTYENLHRDARAFADGLYTAIRNPGCTRPLPATEARSRLHSNNVPLSVCLRVGFTKQTSGRPERTDPGPKGSRSTISSLWCNRVACM
jgi:hypothetical protein